MSDEAPTLMEHNDRFSRHDVSTNRLHHPFRYAECKRNYHAVLLVAAATQVPTEDHVPPDETVGSRPPSASLVDDLRRTDFVGTTGRIAHY